jgi:hypothetical protein
MVRFICGNTVKAGSRSFVFRQELPVWMGSSKKQSRIKWKLIRHGLRADLMLLFQCGCLALERTSLPQARRTRLSGCRLVNHIGANPS